MESATFLMPPSFGLSDIQPNIPEGPEYEKISTLYRCTDVSKMHSNETILYFL